MALLGPAVADPDALTGLVDDDLPLDDSEEAQLEWEQEPGPSGIATAVLDVSRRSRWPRTNPCAVDEGFVIVEPMRSKTEARTVDGSQEVWTFTAVVLVGGVAIRVAGATAEGLGSQVRRCYSGRGSSRRAPVAGPGDGAAWIRAWSQNLGISLQAMISCGGPSETND